MTAIEIIMAIVNVLLVSGGLVTLVSIRSTARQAKSDAKQAETDANTKLMTAFEEHVLEPLTTNNDELKKEIKSLKNEVRKFRNAIDKIEDCPSAHDCPVRLELQKQSARDGEGAD